jgi:hypothetical protein
VPVQMVCHPGSYIQGPLDGGTALDWADGTLPDPKHYLVRVNDTLPTENSCYEYLVSFKTDTA